MSMNQLFQVMELPFIMQERTNPLQYALKMNLLLAARRRRHQNRCLISLTWMGFLLGCREDMRGSGGHKLDMRSLTFPARTEHG